MVQVEIALYDLLPPGKLSTTFYYLGVGIYHTSIRIPELQVEFAYGGVPPGSQTGRDVSTLTGIFVLPSPEDHRVTERLMPGLRFIRRIAVGEAFGDDWLRSSKDVAGLLRPRSIHKPLPPLPESTARNTRRRPKYRNHLYSSSSSGNLPLLTDGDGHAYQEDQSFMSTNSTDEWGRKMSSPPSSNPIDRFSSLSDPLMESPVSYTAPASLPFREDINPSGHMPTKTPESGFLSSPNSLDSGLRKHVYATSPSVPGSITELDKILAVLEDTKKEPEWRATRYHLLAKNCNSFTDELCYRLTGRHAPSFINRAAWLAQSLPCLVPDGWLDPPTAEELQDVTSDANVASRERHQPERPTSPLIAVPYVHTSPMHMDVHYEYVQSR